MPTGNNAVNQTRTGIVHTAANHGEVYARFDFINQSEPQNVVAEFVEAAIGFAKRESLANDGKELSHAEIARRADMSPQQISQLLKQGNTNQNKALSVTAETLIKISIACGLNMAIITTPVDKKLDANEITFPVTAAIDKRTGTIFPADALHGQRAKDFGEFFRKMFIATGLEHAPLVTLLGKTPKALGRMLAGTDGTHPIVPKLNSILVISGKIDTDVSLELRRPSQEHANALRAARHASQ